MQTKNPPQVRPIQQLPEFVQACVDKIWKSVGGAPKNKKDIIFTFHDGIYTLNPFPEDVFVHECVHYVRQGGGDNLELAKQWWDRYAVDPKFRYDEELLAYRAQYKFIQKHFNKPQAFEYAKRLAKDLSSSMYGGMISFEGALNAIIKT